MTKVKIVIEKDVSGPELIEALRQQYEARFGDAPKNGSNFQRGDIVSIGDGDGMGSEFVGYIGVFHSQPDNQGDCRVALFDENGDLDDVYVHISRLTAYTD